MDTVFVSESFRLGHQVPDFLQSGTLKAIASTTSVHQEQEYISYHTDHFSKLLEKGSFTYAVFGNDFDLQGTKTASVLRSVTVSRGIKSIRMAFTKDGYMNIGEFFSPKKLKFLLAMDNLNLMAYKNLSKAGIYNGYRTSVVLGKIYQKKLQENFPVKVKNKKTNTVTYLTKASLDGISIEKAYRKLIKAYETGKIAYPRVDNEYHLENSYDLYAHPPLKEFDKYSTPIEEDELPFNKKTALLFLSNERLITPSTAVFFYRKIDEYFDDDLNPKKNKQKELEIMRKIAKAFEDTYKAELSYSYEKLKMIREPIPPMYKTKNKKKELLEYAFELQRKLEEERLKEKQRKKKKEEVDIETVIRSNIQTLIDFSEGKNEKRVFSFKAL